MNDHTTEPTTNEIPYGYCRCGCGQKTNIVDKNHTRLDRKKGEPSRFIRGHGFRKHPFIKPSKPSKQQSAENRFWARVDKRAPNDCWLWTASRLPNGYGQFSVGRKKIAAHRFSYELHYSVLPEGLFALHKCDVRDCVNPAHLWAGTKAENSQDMVDKNRCKPPHGETHPKAKLTASQVLEIRSLYNAEAHTQSALAAKYNVTYYTIHNIVTGKTWKRS